MANRLGKTQKKARSDRKMRSVRQRHLGRAETTNHGAAMPRT